MPRQAGWEDSSPRPARAGEVYAAKLAPPPSWKALLVLPHLPLATTSARAVLPERYSREDVVANLQRATMLATAFAQGKGELLQIAMEDRIHQPYREEICPLLPILPPLAGEGGILGVALSGAGPAVLLLVEESATMKAQFLVREATKSDFWAGAADLPPGAIRRRLPVTLTTSLTHCISGTYTGYEMLLKCDLQPR